VFDYEANCAIHKLIDRVTLVQTYA
jgi:hypothetical protein